jgi:hypothetical protein
MSLSDGGEPDDDGHNFTLRGQIEQSSVPELLRSVLGSVESGVLTFRKGDLVKSVYLHLGRVVYARSSDPDERLGESLLLRGKITVRQYLEASGMIQPGRRLGAILVEMGALEPEDLLPALEQHVKDILLDVFTWSQGEYELVMSESGLEDLVTLNFSVENLILEGIRRTRAWSRIQRGIGDIDSVLFPTGNVETQLKLELTDEEQEVLSRVNGRATVEQICQASYLSNLETCRILWAMQVLAVIRPGRAEEAKKGALASRQEMDLEGVVETFNQMLGGIHTFLRERTGDEDVNAFMGKALERASGSYGTLFYGVDLKPYGRADYDQMLANVADLSSEERRSLILTGLSELVSAIQLGVRERDGAQEAAVLSGIIKHGFRRLGLLERGH